MLPLRAVVPARLLAASGLRTVALPGKGELLRELSHHCLFPVAAEGRPCHRYAALVRMSFFAALRGNGSPLCEVLCRLTGVRMPMSLRRPTGVCRMATTFNPMSTSKRTPTLRRADEAPRLIKVSLYGNTRPCSLGSRYNLALQRHSSLLMANAVHDLCIARRRFLWTGRWKGLWTA